MANNSIIVRPQGGNAIVVNPQKPCSGGGASFMPSVEVDGSSLVFNLFTIKQMEGVRILTNKGDISFRLSYSDGDVMLSITSSSPQEVAGQFILETSESSVNDVIDNISVYLGTLIAQEVHIGGVEADLLSVDVTWRLADIQARLNSIVVDGEDIKSELDKANREVIGGGADDKVEYLNNSLNLLWRELENAGMDVTDKNTRELAQLITTLPTTYSAKILDENGEKWSVEEWETYKKQNGSAPTENAVVLISTPYASFVIGTYFPSAAYGTTNKMAHSLAGIEDAQLGSLVNVLKNDLRFDSVDNTKRLLLTFNPIDVDGVGVVKTIQYDPELPIETYDEYECVLFGTKDELLNSNLHKPQGEQTYVVLDDESQIDSDGNTMKNVNYYYYEFYKDYMTLFSVPLIDDNGVVGCPAAKFAWEYKAWDNDERQWAMPSINHLLVICSCLDKINECLYAINRSSIPMMELLSCEEKDDWNAYVVNPYTGEVSSFDKGSECAVIPVSAL